jgi:integrase/recombinase XerD
VFVLAEMSGHKNLQNVLRYVTVNDEVKRNAAELI